MSTIHTIDLTTIRVASIDAVEVVNENDWTIRLHLRGGSVLVLRHPDKKSMRRQASKLRAAIRSIAP